MQLDYKDIIIKHYALSMSGSEIARQTGFSKSGVNDFLRAFKKCEDLVPNCQRSGQPQVRESTTFLKKSSSFWIYVVLLRYPYLYNKHIQKLLCLLYHGFLNSTTTYLIFLFVHPPVFDLFGTNQSYFKKQEVPYGKIFRFFQGDDFPLRSH